jgi:hypothetical protein
MKKPMDRRSFLKIAGILDVELTVREFSGTSGIQQLMKGGNSTQGSSDDAD